MLQTKLAALHLSQFCIRYDLVLMKAAHLCPGYSSMEPIYGKIATFIVSVDVAHVVVAQTQ